MRLGQNRAAIPDAIARCLSPPVRNWLANAVGQIGAAAEPGALPLISVIIPVFNGARFLADAIQSVQAQHYPNLEVIVVDDGSTDDLEAAVRALPLELRFLRQHNRGPGAARNLGIKNATGAFLAFLDVDDLWPEDMLRTLLSHLQDHPAVDVVRGHAQLMQPDGAGGYRPVGNPLETFPDYIAAALYRAGAFRAVDLFDQDYQFGEDSDWFDRARAHPIGISTLDLVTLLVRRHGDNMTEGKNLRALHKLQAVKKHLARKRTQT
jgi:glycosyltransferase involved in cell wall biosynthesis